MRVQLNTDSNIEGDSALAQQVEAVVMATLARLSERITWVEVFLTDENGDRKSGTHAMRCVMEARLTGLSPIAVTHQAQTVELAVDGAVGKLERSIETILDRLSNHQGETPPTE
ncbi:MAG: HPF/RaiA family ribosome-associated protein [Chloroflexota bacterium]